MLLVDYLLVYLLEGVQQHHQSSQEVFVVELELVAVVEHLLVDLDKDKVVDRAAELEGHRVDQEAFVLDIQLDQDNSPQEAEVHQQVADIVLVVVDIADIGHKEVDLDDKPLVTDKVDLVARRGMACILLDTVADLVVDILDSADKELFADRAVAVEGVYFAELGAEHFVGEQLEEQLDCFVVVLLGRDFEQAEANQFELVVPVQMEAVESQEFEPYMADLQALAELLGYFVELDLVQFVDYYQEVVQLVRHDFVEAVESYFAMSAEKLEFEDSVQIEAFVEAESFVALVDHYNWVDFHSQVAFGLLAVIYEAEARVATCFAMSLLMTLNTRDYDAELVDETYIHSLCPYSDNLELSVSKSNFHREFSVFVLNQAAGQVFVAVAAVDLFAEEVRDFAADFDSANKLPTLLSRLMYSKQSK